MTATLTDFLLAQLAIDEVAALAASGATVTGNAPGPWSPVTSGDEWEVAPPTGMEVEVLVALRPGLPRPPEVMGGHWGQVAAWHDCEVDADAATPIARHVARHDPARVLADVESKRAVIALMEQIKEESSWYAAMKADDTLRALAQPYRGVDGWQEAWDEA